MTKAPLASILVASMVLLSGCATPLSEEARATVAKFRSARNAGDLRAMHKAVTTLSESGALRYGMTVAEVADVLGDPDNGTGIYCPGGASWGYGPEQPTVHNYGKFYWIHFRPLSYTDPAATKEDIGPDVLLDWD